MLLAFDLMMELDGVKFQVVRQLLDLPSKPQVLLPGRSGAKRMGVKHRTAFGLEL